VSSSEEYAKRSRAELDIDDPSMDTLQTLLLLEIAFKAAGKGKKAYMMLGRFQVLLIVGLTLTALSEWYRNGCCARATPRNRYQDTCATGRTRVQTKAVLDMLFDGQIYLDWIKATLSDL